MQKTKAITSYAKPRYLNLFILLLVSLLHGCTTYLKPDLRESYTNVGHGAPILMGEFVNNLGLSNPYATKTWEDAEFPVSDTVKETVGNVLQKSGFRLAQSNIEVSGHINSLGVGKGLLGRTIITFIIKDTNKDTILYSQFKGASANHDPSGMLTACIDAFLNDETALLAMRGKLDLTKNKDVENSGLWKNMPILNTTKYDDDRIHKGILYDSNIPDFQYLLLKLFTQIEEFYHAPQRRVALAFDVLEIEDDTGDTFPIKVKYTFEFKRPHLPSSKIEKIIESSGYDDSFLPGVNYFKGNQDGFKKQISKLEVFLKNELPNEVAKLDQIIEREETLSALSAIYENSHLASLHQLINEGKADKDNLLFYAIDKGYQDILAYLLLQGVELSREIVSTDELSIPENPNQTTNSRDALKLLLSRYGMSGTGIPKSNSAVQGTADQALRKAIAYIDGPSKILLSNGEYYLGNFKAGKLTGYGEYADTDGNHYEGDFLDDKKHGEGVLVSKNGNVVQRGNWNQDRLDKGLKYQQPNCQVENINIGKDDWHYTQGGCSDWLANGHGKAMTSDGNHYLEGQFLNGEFVKGSYFRYDTEEQGTWKNGLRHGAFTKYKKGEITFIGQYVDGKRHGEATCLYNETLESCSYYDGRRTDQLYLVREEIKKEQERYQRELRYCRGVASDFREVAERANNFLGRSCEKEIKGIERAMQRQIHSDIYSFVKKSKKCRARQEKRLDRIKDDFEEVADSDYGNCGNSREIRNNKKHANKILEVASSISKQQLKFEREANQFVDRLVRNQERQIAEDSRRINMELISHFQNSVQFLVNQQASTNQLVNQINAKQYNTQGNPTLPKEYQRAAVPKYAVSNTPSNLSYADREHKNSQEQLTNKLEQICRNNGGRWVESLSSCEKEIVTPKVIRMAGNSDNVRHMTNHPSKRGYMQVTCTNGRTYSVYNDFRRSEESEKLCGGSSSKRQVKSSAKKEPKKQKYEILVESVAFCWKSKRENWHCDGPRQKTELGDKSLDEQLHYACGAERNSFNSLIETPFTSASDRKGSIYYCNKALQSYERDIASKYQLDTVAKGKRLTFKCKNFSSCELYSERGLGDVANKTVVN